VRCARARTVGKCNNECGADPVIEVNCSKSRSLIISAERLIMILTQLIALIR